MGISNPFSNSKPGGQSDVRRRGKAEGDIRDIINRLLDQPLAGQAGLSDAATGLGDLSRTLAGYGTGYLEDIAPVRQELGGILTDVLRGGRPEAMRVFAPERDALEAQFGRARENVLAKAPVRGGQLGRSLIDLETQRALGIGQQEADVRRNAMALAAGFGSNVAPGFGALQGAGGLLQGAGNLFQGMGAQQLQGLLGAGGLAGGQSDRALQAYQQKKQSLGSMMGTGAGIGLLASGAMCWVAAALYGWASPEWAAARRTVGRWPRWAQWAYRRLGPLVGVLARRSPRLRAALRPTFDRIVLAGWEG